MIPTRRSVAMRAAYQRLAAFVLACPNGNAWQQCNHSLSVFMPAWLSVFLSVWLSDCLCICCDILSMDHVVKPKQSACSAHILSANPALWRILALTGWLALRIDCFSLVYALSFKPALSYTVQPVTRTTKQTLQLIGYRDPFAFVTLPYLSSPWLFFYFSSCGTTTSWSGIRVTTEESTSFGFYRIKSGNRISSSSTS